MMEPDVCVCVDKQSAFVLMNKKGQMETERLFLMYSDSLFLKVTTGDVDLNHWLYVLKLGQTFRLVL